MTVVFKPPGADHRGEASRVSVIMPAYNASAYLKVSLPPLAQMLRRGEILELIVVDDCSTDDTAEVALAFGARVLRMAENGGPGAARNYAARRARGEILWLVDADVVAKPGSASLIEATLSEPGVGAMFGAYDDRPPAKNFSSQYKNLVHRYYHQRSAREASTFWAGCGAILRDVYLAVGGFDVDRFKRPSIEDIELGDRIRASGSRIILEPCLQGTHLKAWSLSNLLYTDIFCRAVPWSRMIVSRGRIGNDLNVSVAERLRAAAAGGLVASMAAAAIWPQIWPLTLATALLVLVINTEFLAFMTRIRGPLFGLGAVAFHQVYYLYSAAAFVFCTIEGRLTRVKNKASSPRLAPLTDLRSARCSTVESMAAN